MSLVSSRRLALKGASAIGAGLMLPAAMANPSAYPKSPIKLIVTFAPGGATDAVARRLGERLGKILGVPIVVENKPGAAGMIATDILAKSPADGHTLALVLSGVVYSNPFIYNKVPYDVDRDLALVTKVLDAWGIITIHPSVPAKDFKELAAYIKANPGKLSFGSYGQGSFPHQLCEYLRHVHGLDMNHVPYKGEAPIVQDLLANQIQVAYGSVAVQKQHIELGKLRAVGSVTAKRLPVMPNLPTLYEQGFTDDAFRLQGWFGIIAPKKVPMAIQKQLAQSINQVMKEPEMQASIRAMSFEPVSDSGPEQLMAEYREWMPRWKKVAEISGAKIDG